MANSGRGFTKGNMERENEHQGDNPTGVYDVGDRPGHAGEFQECTPQGDLLGESTRIQLDHDDEPLPPTSQKNNKWRIMN